MITLATSSGFWIMVNKKLESKDLGRKLLIGLAHDRIVYLSMKYIECQCITQDEYENLVQYLYEPYLNLGGNGSVKRLMEEVNKLAIINNRRRKDDVSN